MIYRLVSTSLIAFFLLTVSAQSQELQTKSQVIQVPQESIVLKKDVSWSEELSNNKFRQQLIQAAVASHKKGDISRLDLLRIRVASFSPAMLKKIEDLAVVQIAASGESGPFSVDENGEIIRETVDWDNLIAFLEKLIPLILLLLKAFGI